MTLSEAANRVIDLAGKVTTYYETELRKRYPNYPLVDLDEDSVPPPAEEKQLADFLGQLPDGLLYRLMLLVDLGRYETTVDNLAGHLANLKHTIGDREQVIADLMVFVGVLADLLTDGLAVLHEHKIDADRMPLRKAKVPKR